METVMFRDGEDRRGRELPRAVRTRQGDLAVSTALIRLFCSVIEDGNRVYWDDQYAEKLFGGVVSPPAMLRTWTMPLRWNPGKPTSKGPFLDGIPGSGSTLVNSASEARFFKTLPVGMRLHVTDQVTGVSDLKHTRIGPGRYITIESTYRDRGQELVARHTIVVFRFDPPARAAKIRTRLRRAEPSVPGRTAPSRGSARDVGGARLPDIRFRMSRADIAYCAWATLDAFPGHHDPSYAEGQGQPDIYLNTMALEGLVDRCATDWLGHNFAVRRRTLRMLRPAFPNRSLTATGRVHSVRSGCRATITKLLVEVADEVSVLCSAELVLGGMKRRT